MEPIGPLQLRVMRHIWSSGPCTVHQVHEVLNADPKTPDLAYTTILTVMRNLAKRDILEQNPNGRSHIFTPKLSQDEYRCELLSKIADDLFDGKVAEMSSYLSDE